MKNKRIIKIILLVAGIIIILGLLGILVVKSIKKKYNSITGSEITYNFNEYEVTTENISSYIKGTGIINSFNIKKLDVPNYANIKELYINDGDKVIKNQKLLKINSDGYITDIKSPIDGMFFMVENYENVSYEIYDINNIGVEIKVNENDVTKLAIGQKAILKIMSLNKEVEGEVIYVSKLPVEGMFKVKIKIDYFEELRFGYGVNVKVNIEEKNNVKVIPYQALYMDENNKYYVIKEEYRDEYYNDFFNSVSGFQDQYKTYVEVGTITNTKVEIVSGLSVGDKVYEWNW